jgi:hypothetical protein
MFAQGDQGGIFVQATVKKISAAVSPKSKAREMRAEFIKKNNILSRKYSLVSPLDYYISVFGADIDEEHILLLINDKTKYHKSSDIDDILMLSQQRSDAFIFPCAFFKGFVNKATLRKIYAITIDLDSVSPKDLSRLILSNYAGGLVPTYVVNSGQGVHIVYNLSVPIECYNSLKPQIHQITLALKSRLGKRLQDGHADYNTSIMQSYRVVGSLTKLGQITTAYKVGKSWGVEELAQILRIDWQVQKADLPSPQKTKLPKQKKKVGYLPNGMKYLWEYCLKRMKDVPEGNRYTALYALSIVAYKCRIPLEELKKSLESCMNYYNERDNTIVRRSELNKAIKGYSQKHVLVSSQKLEEYFGWTFERKTKRNGRTRENHLIIAHATSAAVRKVDKTAKIKAYLTENPDASVRQISKALHMSFSTVVKYR